MLKKTSGRARSLWGEAGKGILLAMGITLAGAMLLAKLVDREIISMKTLGYWAMVLLAAGVWAAAAFPMGNTTGRKYAAAAMGAGGYFSVLLAINGLFFGGAYPGLLTGLIVTLLTSVAAMLTVGKGRRSSSRRRYKIPKV